MGYFNIFYKITRIIDFFTRKRNRKLIFVLLILIVVVFIFHNKVNAQEDNLQYNQTFTHSHIRLNSDGTVQYGTINTSNLYYSLVFPVKEGFTYKGACTSAPSDAPLKVGFISELDNMIYTYTSIENATYVNYGPGAVSIIGTYNPTTGFEITAASDGYFIIGGFRPSGSAISYQDCGFQVYTDYNGQSNLNTINQDLLRIEELLKDYLYGDSELYDVSLNSVSMIIPKDFNDSDTSTQTGTFIRQTGGNYITYYFKIKKDYRYYIDWLKVGTYQSYGVRYGYTNNIPAVGVPFGTCTRWLATDPNGIEIVSDGTYQYFYITFNQQIAVLSSVKSNYNEGQELGVYGGLTNIQQTTINQETQTRETITYEGQEMRNTITDTDIPTNEMTIDTSIVNGVDNTDNDNFLTSIINKFQTVITPSSTVTTIVIPIPKTGKNITLRSDLLSRHISNTIIGTYITIFWYVVFFIYFFKFAYRVINWVITGEIIEKPSAFMKYLMEQNAVITASMM